MKFNDAISGLVLLLAGAYAWWESADYPPGVGGQYGSAFFPRIVAVLMIMLGAGLIASGLKARRDAGSWVALERWAKAPRSLAGAAILIGALAFMTVALEPLGFPLTAIVATFGFTLYLRGRPVSSLAFTVASVTMIHLLFSKAFSVVLPLGVLESLFR